MLLAGAINTNSLPTNTFSVSFTVRFLSDKYFIHLLLAEINKSAGAPSSTCLAKVDEDAKENTTSLLAFSALYFSAICCNASVMEAAANTVIFADAAKDTPIPAIKSAVANLVNFIMKLYVKKYTALEL